ncbi:hypothetical protein CSUI_008739 [Cystoisospora suis]|uniref:Uncharacterized protein n=1 Tax=Cystoisospora suis TaxID=483139 RepID=A0A2C6KLR2_9APIC|nr:hypothetical protein CSUI_008739 [Cystoisospora suis]
MRLQIINVHEYTHTSVLYLDVKMYVSRILVSYVRTSVTHEPV